MNTIFKKKVFAPKRSHMSSRSEELALTDSNREGAANGPRILVIGAGSRGQAYSRLIAATTRGRIVAVAEPHEYQRRKFAALYGIEEGLVFTTWEEILDEERKQSVLDSVDGMCVCTLDETHEEIVKSLRSLNLHILCEKPLGASLESCIGLCNSVCDPLFPPVILATGHVLRYSPHNLLLRKLVCEERAVGEVVNVNHTENIGWYHFAHSYVRGNWRKSATSAPTLLTKCCHDIDFLLWLLSSTPANDPHLPARVYSTGSLVHFRRERKPRDAGAATNCLECAAEPECLFSAKRIYIEKNLRHMNMGWPVKIVAPDIEEAANYAAAEEKLLARLAEDYTDSSMVDGVQKNYYGRCVYQNDNDVIDNQVVTISWDDDFSPDGDSGVVRRDHGAKTATLTMVAFSEKISERFTRIHGTKGEIEADGTTIKVSDFQTGQKKVYQLDRASGHGGGDEGLAKTFVDAIDKIKNEGWTVEKAQVEVVGITVGETLRSHATVFWADEARLTRRVLDWDEWWTKNVAEKMTF